MTEAASRPAAAGPGRQPWTVPASYAQERVWFASQLARGATVYRVGAEFMLRYPVGAEDIVAALNRICERHETLRTSFQLSDGQLMQVVHPDVVPPVRQADLSGLSEQDQQRWLSQTFASLAAAEIPLDRAPLWQATLARLGPAAWAVLIVAHHAAFDAASIPNLHAELTELCAAAAQGRPARLPELPIQYADYAAWQRDRLEHGRMAELLAFWRTALAGLPEVHGLGTDLPRPAERSFAGADLIFALPAGTGTAAAELARRHSATPFMVLFAAYAALLHRLSGAGDIVIGLPLAGRDRAELRSLIGMFVNMTVVRVDASGDPSFLDLLDRARLALIDAWDHEVPFQKLVETLPRPQDPAVPPLYQLGFNYLSIGFSRPAPGTADDLLLEIAGDRGRLEYNTALFTEQTAGRIADGYQSVLRAVLADPGVRMSRLPVAVLRPAGPATDPGAPAAGGPPHVPPRTAAEELVAGVWSDVLGAERVGALDDFIELGGHSLLALRVIARLSAAIGAELPIQSFFADTTVAGVAAELERLLAAELAGMPDDEAARLAAGEG